jgi:DNA polymerase-3 subunit gamma/tau
LSLDLFRDLQFSLQPRFHLELGLIRMVQAGRLVSIEQALANLGSAPVTAPPPPLAPRPVPTAPVLQAPAPPKGPSPFELDRAKKAQALEAAPAAAPASGAEWKERLHATLMEIGMAFTADGVEHSTVVEAGGELQFTTPEAFMLGMKADDLNQAVRRIVGRPMRIKITAGQGSATIEAPQVRKGPEDEVSLRALENPEVKKFQEVFGGQVRTVRNLKE